MTNEQQPTLRDRIKSELETPGTVTLHDVAATIAKATPDRELRAALTEALTFMVREIVASSRPSPQDPMPGTSARSSKVTAIREAERLRRSDLDARYATDAGYKQLRHFSYEDLVALADRTQHLAEANGVQAKKWRRVAAAMRKAGVATVAGLGDDALRALGVSA